MIINVSSTNHKEREGVRQLQQLHYVLIYYAASLQIYINGDLRKALQNRKYVLFICIAKLSLKFRKCEVVTYQKSVDLNNAKSYQRYLILVMWPPRTVWNIRQTFFAHRHNKQWKLTLPLWPPPEVLVCKIGSPNSIVKEAKETFKGVS